MSIQTNATRSEETLFRTPQEVAADIAREFREDASRWIQGWLARDKDGQDVYEDSPKAVCWCLRGAIDLRAAHDHDDGGALATATYGAFDAAIGANPEPNCVAFVAWNDKRGRTVNEVIALCDKVAQS